MSSAFKIGHIYVVLAVFNLPTKAKEEA